MSGLEELAKEIMDSGLFDEAWYLSKYQDAGLVGLSPIQHFVRFGLMLKRDPGPSFATRLYMENYRDVEEAGMDPVLHYIRFGKAEGRRPF